MNKPIVYAIILVLVATLCPIVLAENYVPTGSKDFSVWIDPQPYLDGKMYATVDMGSTYEPEYKCVTVVFAVQPNNTYIHVQSNPELAKPGMFVRTDGTSPEELGYFKVTNGVGTVYFRKFNQITGINFLYVVKCNTDTDQLVWEDTEFPTYREIAKGARGYTAWFASQEDIGFVVAMAIGVIIVIFLIIAIVRKR
jgi:hypothetical protein